MSKNWGRSFLKSGLPLEHLSLVMMNSVGWDCAPHQEYERPNREGEPTWFEIDLCASKSQGSENNMELLIECKYHDESRFWFFLPWSSSDFQAEYHATEAGENQEANCRVFNYCPFEVLEEPDSDSALALAPKSLWGVVVNKTGQKEENMIEKALKQLSGAFVPYTIERFFTLHNITPTAVLSVIVTNANIYRLRSKITNLSEIARASSPEDVADKLKWTWCYFSPRADILIQNNALIHDIEERAMLKPLDKVTSQLLKIWTAPSWFAVINIQALSEVVTTIFSHFSSLKKDISYMKALEAYRSRSIKERRKMKSKTVNLKK